MHQVFSLLAVAAACISTGFVSCSPVGEAQAESADPLDSRGSLLTSDQRFPIPLTCSPGSGYAETKVVSTEEDSIVLRPGQATRYMKIWFPKGNQTHASSDTLRELTIAAAAAEASVPPGRRSVITMSYAGCTFQGGPILIYQQVGRRLRPLITRVDVDNSTATATLHDFAQHLPDKSLSSLASWGMAVSDPATEYSRAPTSRFVLGTP